MDQQRFPDGTHQFRCRAGRQSVVARCAVDDRPAEGDGRAEPRQAGRRMPRPAGPRRGQSRHAPGTDRAGEGMGRAALGWRCERPARRQTRRRNAAIDRGHQRVSIRLKNELRRTPAGGQGGPKMSATQKDPVLVVLQLTGGNDYLNTVIPYNDPLYRDNRKAVSIGDNQILHIDKDYGFAPYLAPLKKFWDDGNLALMHGVGYLDSPRSHFRSMDIWHTCEADKVGTEGWLGRVAREIDPKKENVVTTVSFGPTLFRALSVPDVPVACVAGPLEKYGFLPGIQEQEQRLKILERFARMYKPEPGSGVMEYLGTTGLDSLKGADILKVAPQKYKSTVQYPDSSIARKLRGIAQVHFAGLGSRIFYCDHASFDTHAGQGPMHAMLWTQVTEGQEHG